MCSCLAKNILVGVNLILTVASFAILALGVSIVTGYKYFQEEIFAIELEIDFLPTFLITLGVIAFIISFSGCCGAILESICMLKTYAVFMGILAVLKVAFTIFLFMKNSELSDGVRRVIDESFSSDPGQNLPFHGLESTFKCCGTTGPDSYINDYNLTSPTCCEKFNEDPTTTDDANRICTKDEAYPQGCSQLIRNFFYDTLKIVGFILIGFIVYEILTLTFALYVAATIQMKIVGTEYY